MSATGPASVQELVDRIRQGLVPRAIRLFAAQGLLPVSREELIRLLVLLVAEGDDEIAKTARATLDGFTEENFLVALAQPDIEAIDIELLCRASTSEAVWQAAVRHPKTANETLRYLARVAPPSTQDSIITNQTRIMGCLEILEDLRGNANAGQDVLRRVREFEEEFLEKAVVWASTPDARPLAEPGPSIEDALRALKDLGMHLPDLGSAKAEVEPEDGAPREIHDAFVRVALMNTFERIMAALKGSREERLILCRDRSLLVARAVALSPRLTEQDVDQISGMRSANDECLRIIASKGRWLRRYTVVRNLAFNPKTPTGIALQLLGRLTVRDLGSIARDRNVPATVRKMANERFSVVRR